MRKNILFSFKVIFTTVLSVFLVVSLTISCKGKTGQTDEAKQQGESTRKNEVKKSDVNVKSNAVKAETGKGWPASMPREIPVFTKGIIGNIQSATVAGRKTINIIINNVEMNDAKDYAGKLDETGYESIVSNIDYSGITKNYKKDKKILTYTYNADSKEAIIQFVEQ